MVRTGVVRLEFHPERDDLSKDKELRDGLSVALQIDDTLWVANDETVSLERLTLVPNPTTGLYTSAGEHQQFSLYDYLNLPVPLPPDPADLEEADIEGLAVANGYLWLVGSHSLKRKQPKRGDDPNQARKQLAKVGKDGNRYLLARIPLVTEHGTLTLDRKRGDHIAALLHGDIHGNDLMDALKDDEHLKPFLSIPGKDNGFDIEGLAVVGQRLFLGLRGPVLRGWAIVLEVEPIEENDNPSLLRLARIGPNGRRYRKHFLHLNGLGIRDLCVQGRDMLILAGPTMDLDGPVRVFRWQGGADPEGEDVVTADRLEPVLDVPFGEGEDHAEGLALFSPDGGDPRFLLIVYDAASEQRQSGDSVLTADVFG